MITKYKQLHWLIPKCYKINQDLNKETDFAVKCFLEIEINQPYPRMYVYILEYMTHYFPLSLTNQLSGEGPFLPCQGLQQVRNLSKSEITRCFTFSSANTVPIQKLEYRLQYTSHGNIQAADNSPNQDWLQPIRSEQGCSQPCDFLVFQLLLSLYFSN